MWKWGKERYKVAEGENGGALEGGRAREMERGRAREMERGRAKERAEGVVDNRGRAVEHYRPGPPNKAIYNSYGRGWRGESAPPALRRAPATKATS